MVAMSTGKPISVPRFIQSENFRENFEGAVSSKVKFEKVIGKHGLEKTGTKNDEIGKIHLNESDYTQDWENPNPETRISEERNHSRHFSDFCCVCFKIKLVDYGAVPLLNFRKGLGESVWDQCIIYERRMIWGI